MQRRFFLLVFCPLILFSILFISCKDDVIEPELTGSIDGRILDESTNVPIKGASVTTSPASNAVVTDDAGKFNLSALPVGTYSIIAVKAGYKKAVTNVSVKHGTAASANIFMAAGNDSYSVPKTPDKPSPENNKTDVSTSISLKWSSANNKGDSIKFNVYLFTSDINNRAVVGENIKDTSVVLSNLDYGTTYYWQVAAVNGSGEISNSDVWGFKTKSFPNNPYYYISNSGGTYEIYSSDGTEAVRITNNTVNEISPRINPKFDLIAFASNEDIDMNIYTVTKQGKELKKISQIPIAGFNNIGSGFSWSPDGTKLIYPNFDKLIRLPSTGGMGDAIATAPVNRNFREASYDATGNKIIALTMGQNFYDSEIYTMNSDGSGMTMVVENLPGAVGSPSFAPNGKSIIYTHDADGYQSSTNRQMNTRIYVKVLDTGDLTDISKNKPDGTNDLDPRFSPDGSKVIFTNIRNDGQSPSVWIMDVTGNNRTKISDSARMPDWN